MREERVIPIYIEDEMKRSYLDYAMSVIVGRALPDVRDGLKPVQRRILYAMREMGLTPTRGFKKSAAVVGDVLGKYHPHGDMAIYDALARMAQGFSLRYPLIEGQGNFGSIDGDAPAAYRYTEVRLSSLAERLLNDLEFETVEFASNFDGRLREPRLLPAEFPNLLLNGASGIAVGMATNIPPHNFGEVIDGLVALIENPELSVDQLMEHIKGPDFPTGGCVIGRRGLEEAYRTGRGRVVVRGQVRLEEWKGGKRALIITEVPYQVNKAGLIAQIADLVKEKKLEGISELRDESDRDGIRVVIELKRDVDPNLVLSQLYYHTSLQSTYGIILLALIDNVPRVMNLKEISTHFLEFRYQAVERRTRFLLQRAEERAHILEGLKIALSHLDAIISLIRSSKDLQAAKAGLVRRFGLSEAQAQAILDMKLARLTHLERSKVEEEYEEVIKEIARFSHLLESRVGLMSLIKEELLELKRRFADPRRTQLLPQEVEDFRVEDLIAQEEIVVILTHRGYIKRMPVSLYRRQLPGGVGRAGVEMGEEDWVAGIFTAQTHDHLLFLSDQGQIYWLRVYEVPEGSFLARGRAIANLLQLAPGEGIAFCLGASELNENQFLCMATQKGRVKRVSMAEFQSRRQGMRAINLAPDDQLVAAFLSSGRDDLMLITDQARAVRFSEKGLRPMGRNAAGVKGVALPKGARVVDAVVIPEGGANQELLLLTAQGYGKRMPYPAFPVKRRGGKGVIAARLTKKSGPVIKAIGVKESDEVILISKLGTALRIRVSEVRRQGRASTGVRLMSLREGDRVVDLARVAG